MTTEEKYEKLLDYLASMDKVLIALSGGLDSALLLRAAKDALGNRTNAVTVSTPYMPKRETLDAAALAREMTVNHKLLPLPLIDAIKFNPEDRCYRCKRHFFSILKTDARRSAIPFILEGTHVDDLTDFRPGIQALKELSIISPYLHQEWTKRDIRETAQKLGIRTWHKRPGACLLSRMPYGHEITLRELGMIERAEQYLADAGFECVRVRSYGNLARIEVGREERRKFFSDEILDDLSAALKEIGYLYVTMELEGYRMGSMNLVLTEKNV
jgi:uncharacterized protein